MPRYYVAKRVHPAIRRRIKPNLFALGQSLGPRATGQSWNEPSLHDISATLDGRFLQATSQEGIVDVQKFIFDAQYVLYL